MFYFLVIESQIESAKKERKRVNTSSRQHGFSTVLSIVGHVWASAQTTHVDKHCIRNKQINEFSTELGTKRWFAFTEFLEDPHSKNLWVSFSSPTPAFCLTEEEL